MSWIILALTLGASITSIIHGVFMLFGSLSISGSALPGIPSIVLAVMPIAAAVSALIGGVIAFNQSKWGSVFLFIAAGICASSRDTWLYSGLYLLAGLCCFFLKSKRDNDFQDMSFSDYDDDENENSEIYPDAEDFYYEQDNNIQPVPLENADRSAKNIDINFDTIDDDIAVKVKSEPPKLRRRTTKSCPECGAVVSRDSRFCSTCGTKLFVFPEDELESAQSSVDEVINVKSLNEQLLTIPTSEEVRDDFKSEIEDTDKDIDINENISGPETKFNSNDGDDMSNEEAVPNYRVLVKPQRDARENPQRNTRRAMNSMSDSDNAASSYQEFSKYARRGKKRKRSAGRKVLSMLLLVAAVGGALYFLLGLRKLPPGDLPPMVRPEVISLNENNNNQNQNNTPSIIENTAEPELVVAENVLPNFTPERTPSNGVITGSAVNVRADHSTTSNRITRLNVGSRVEITGSYNVTSGQYAGIWYNVRTGGRDGWIYGRYVQPLGSGLPAGYSNALLKSFGNNRTQLIETFGQPSRSTSSSAEWSGITATLRGEDITRIRLSSSNRELQNGLKTGMSQTALLQIMGYPSSVNNRVMNYNEGSRTGISVQLDRNNSISTITVNEIQ